MSDNLRSKIGIQERGHERDFPKGFYVGQTFPLTKVNESDVFKCYATLSGELELLTDFSPDVKVGKYAHSEASEVIRLQPGQAAIVAPNVVLQQRGHGEMAVLYFSSKVTKNKHAYVLRPERQVIPVPDEQRRRMFTFLSDYSRCGWRGEYSFRIIDQLLEMVNTGQARSEVDDFLMSAMKFIRHYVASNIKAPSIEKILTEVKIPVAYRHKRDFGRIFKEQVGVKIRTFCGDQRLYLAVVEAALHSMSFARDNLRYTCANFNHAFSSSFGVSPSAAYHFSDIITARI
jgi:hypothetical protein